MFMGITFPSPAITLLLLLSLMLYYLFSLFTFLVSPEASWIPDKYS